MMKIFGLEKKGPLVAPLSKNTPDLSAQERCLKHLSQWKCELSLDGIPPRRNTSSARGSGRAG
ncbi:hypothetical protein F4781DRAFT_412416 [Annulohypoxylon bovei var. microspora]|nr:hypothetical protein F4781DRAFT_412416 [Annulohypoxylon bovei var. microspora]